MSNNYSSSASYSYTTSSSTSTTGQQTSSSVYSQQAQQGPDGTRVQTVSQNDGEPAVQETRQWDAHGREQVLNGSGAAGIQGPGADRRVEDVTGETDADRLYRERMEDEYAKREGGA